MGRLDSLTLPLRHLQALRQEAMEAEKAESFKLCDKVWQPHAARE